MQPSMCSKAGEACLESLYEGGNPCAIQQNHTHAQRAAGPVHTGQQELSPTSSDGATESTPVVHRSQCCETLLFNSGLFCKEPFL